MSIGEYLRAEREKRGLSLTDVEKETKIRVKYLQALESENFQEIPGRAYVLGFLRAYARFLGIDEEEIVAAYKQQHPEESWEVFSPEQAKEEVEEGEFRGDRKTQLFQGKRLLSGIVMIFILGVLIFSVVFFSLRQTEEPSPSPPSRFSVPQETPQLTDESEESKEELGVEVKLVATEECWVLVRQDGEEIFSGIMRPGETKTFRAEETIWLKLGNAGGVEVYFNGKKVPPLGHHGEVVTKEFTKHFL
ncbi:MAG: Transcriptional regulator XRE family [Thermoanaerobacterales bacterium 50_218]|nr:MAG: Transcriptional regulator XRE family [Thermoanaerobacterales bacterium 50_218]HAA89545.1 hypothetical protein [Peptococcaceae bacterium]